MKESTESAAPDTGPKYVWRWAAFEIEVSPERARRLHNIGERVSPNPDLAC